MAIEIGKKAPAFTLRDQNGEKVSLASLKGQWVVLYFYPKDDTPGCTTEACEFTAGASEFRGLNAKVLGCSPDNQESHLRFVGKHQLDVTLLCDPSHEVMEKYGAWGEKKLYGRVSQGVIRSTVVIDPTGKVVYHFRKVRAAGHAAKVREKLAELRSNG